MKYVIQIFKTENDSNVGSWHNIRFDGGDLAAAKIVAEKIASGNKMGIVKVRVLELVMELECK